MEFKHVSVLLEETINNLNINEEGIYVDGTLGSGGHAYEVCCRLSEKGRLIGFDQDDAAIAAASERLKEFGDRVTIIHSNYRNMKEELYKLGITKVDGILLDLGVSSYQLDTAERGFAYKLDAPLDMRMDRRKSQTAKDIINTYKEEELTQILRDYGEEKFARKIARLIVTKREKREITTTGELISIIEEAIPYKFRVNGGHPAKRTFQAIRIELNEELSVLRDTLDDMVELLNERGRLCIITFHSLEDRIVKVKFKNDQNPCTCPSDFPICVCGKKPKGKMVGRKPILPTDQEMEKNKRSKSAKLRVFEKGATE